jgi:CxxC motif-containing protein (DUF1111 family)
MFLRLSIPPQNDQDRRLLTEHRRNVTPEPTYGGQLQDFAIQGHPAEGRMRIDYADLPVALSGGEQATLRQPRYAVTDLGYGPMHPDTLLSPRIAPQMIGLGLLEAIPEQALLDGADPDDANGDGISGRPNQVWSGEHDKVMPGRFGWKAGAPSVNEQSQGAFAGDIGISVPLHPNGWGECSDRQAGCRQAANGNSPQYQNLEANDEITQLVMFYSHNLAVPARRESNHPDVLAGRTLFYQTGCQQCHTPSFTTASDSIGPEQSNQTIWPYTDLLLHDMGEGARRPPARRRRQRA